METSVRGASVQCCAVKHRDQRSKSRSKSSSDGRGSHDLQVPPNLQGRLEKSHCHLSEINDETR